MYRGIRIYWLPLLTAICGCMGSDQDRLEGTWEPVEARIGRSSTQSSWFPFIAVDFLRDYVTFRSSGAQVRATFSLSSQGGARHIDIYYGRSGEEEKLEGLYKFENDYQTLLLCIAAEGEPRPSKLEPHPDNDRVLYVKLIRRAAGK